ncbi:hypothetical protein JQ597_04535 [Bradyrhizobium sp. AUGA SZCCT0177]|nr:hypothetical protein [Bradyrhizobium sp. AUGA SZCCT0177]
MTARAGNRAARIVTAGKTLFGPTRWQSAMARLTGLSPALIQKIAAGDDGDRREVTDDVYRKVAMALLKEGDLRRLGAAKVDELARKMLAELEGMRLSGPHT